MARKKSAAKSAPGKPFAKGGDPRQGKGPAKGAPNAGRPPDEFKRRMQALASKDEALEYLDELLTKPKGRGKTKVGADPQTFLKAFKETADRGYGKAVQPLEHGGPDGGPIPIVDGNALVDRLARALAGIAKRSGATADPGES